MLSLGEYHNYYSTWCTRQYVRIPVQGLFIFGKSPPVFPAAAGIQALTSG